MGMGEPFLNFDAVLASARRLPDLGITHRRTTISTVGWMPGLRRFVDKVEEPESGSLCRFTPPTPAKRSQLMPVNERYPLAEVLAEWSRYSSSAARRVFVKYVMLAGVNDSPAELGSSPGSSTGRRTRSISFLTTRPGLRRLDAPGDRRFQGETSTARGMPATVRLTRGRDIEAACGQLGGFRRLEDSRMGLKEGN